MSDINLSEADNRILREKGIIQQDEVALRSGDLLLAENVITGSRRVLSDPGKLLESTRRLLND